MPSTGLPTATTNDAIAARHFAVEIDSTAIAQFTEVSGLSSEIDVIELKENLADGKYVVKKLPGARKAPKLTLKRGKSVSMDLYNWHKDMLDGKVSKARKNGSVVMYDFELGEVARWNFHNAWVSKLSSSGLKSGSNEVVTEEATIECEWIERVK